jgi:hypothetical protein
MADKKISALTAATTPLAGTEVLPIVQSGSTVKVSVNNLTAGKAVSVGSLTSAGSINVADNFSVNWGNGNSYITGNGAGFGLSAYVAATKIWSIDGSGATTFDFPVNLNNVNLVIGTAGKGIDFSAATHAAGMTSELLNDYEEGTWTPTQGANLTVVGSFSSSGTYTKIGRLVMVRGVLSATTSLAYASTAAVICGGLPFTNAATCPGLAFNQGFNVSSTIVADTGTNVVAVEAMAATPQVVFTITYYV